MDDFQRLIQFFVRCVQGVVTSMMTFSIGSFVIFSLVLLSIVLIILAFVHRG